MREGGAGDRDGALPGVWYFDTFELDAASGELRRSGRRIPLQEKPLQLLLALLERPREVLTREELQTRLWPEDSFLEFDDSLNTAVSKLRHALGDAASSPRFVETVPRRGYRFLVSVKGPSHREVENETEEAKAAVEETRAPLPGETSQRQRDWRLILATGTLALLALVAVSGRWRDSRRSILEPGSTTPLTTAVGLEDRAAFSPDGRRFAFASDALGQMDIWVQQVAAGPPVVLTQDNSGYDGNPVWSPDGEWIAFVSDRNGGGLFVMTALGGALRQLAVVPFSPSVESIASTPTLAWAPDGETLVYAFGRQERKGLFRLPIAGGEPQQLELSPQPSGFALIEPAFHPNGLQLAFVSQSGSGTTVSRLWSVDTRGGEPTALTEGQYADRQPVFAADGRRLFFLSDRSGTMDVWWMAVDDGGMPASEPQRLTAGLGIGSFALDPTGRGLVYSRLEERSSILSAPLSEARASRVHAEATTVFSENHLIEHFDLGSGSDWMVFDSTRGGRPDIWVIGRDGKALRRLSDPECRDWHPDLSLDGRSVAYHSLCNGQRELHFCPLGGGPPTILASSPSEDWLPELSPAGDLVVFSSDRSGNPDIWVVPTTGGEPSRLTTHPGNDHNPLWTRDGTAVVFASNRLGQEELWQVRLADGELRQISVGEWIDVIPFAWDPDGAGLYVWGHRGDAAQARLWRVGLEDGAPSVVRCLYPRGRLAPSLDVDAERLYFLVWERVGDLWYVELVESS